MKPFLKTYTYAVSDVDFLQYVGRLPINKEELDGFGEKVFEAMEEKKMDWISCLEIAAERLLYEDGR